MFYYNLYEVKRNEEGEVKDLVFINSYDFINDLNKKLRSCINNYDVKINDIKTYICCTKLQKEYTIFKDYEEEE